MLAFLQLGLKIAMTLTNTGFQLSAMAEFVSLLSHRFLVSMTVSVLLTTHISYALAQGPSTNTTTPPQVQDFDWDNVSVYYLLSSHPLNFLIAFVT